MATIDKLIVEVGADIKDLQKKLKTIDKNIGGVDKNVKKASSSFDGLGGAITAALSVGALLSFGKSIIDTIGKFEKLEAVLTNTLGSSSEAQKSMAMIQDFASKTPFSVDQLTSSFVKLANQGFKPTREEMRSLGDLAASTGKDFDMLAEAVIDAQVGEFERLKEFGIRASKSGDQVKFTFKGVETQVKNTEENIRSYITSLGDAQGVSGSMAAISETLEGKISNLGDSYDQFILSLNSGQGVLGQVIKGLTDLASEALAGASAIAKGTAALELEKQLAGVERLKDSAEGMANTLVDGFTKAGLKGKELNKAIIRAMESSQQMAIAAKWRGDNDLAGQYAAEVHALKKLNDGIQEEAAKVKATTVEYKKYLDTVDKVSGVKNTATFSQPLTMQLATPTEGTGNPYADMVSNAQIAAESIGYYSDEAQRKIEELGYKTAGVAEGINIGFSGIASVIGQQLGLAAGSMASFVQAVSSTFLQIIANALSVSMANAITGATGAAAVAGPFAPAVLPATIATMTGSVLAAFAAIPQMADGGLFFGESLAMVGEGRGTSLTNPEVIAPLDKLKSFIGGDGAGGMQNVKFELEGQKLVGVINRYNKQNRY